MTLTPFEMAIAALLAAFVIGTIIFLFRGRRTARLRAHYGAEYARTLEEKGNAARTEAELRDREKRAAAFDIRPLSPAQRQGFIEHWQLVQAKFVDDPQGAVMRADVLLAEVMEAQGYPMADFEQRAADLSVDHAHVVENYRAGRALVLRGNANEATTEDMRQAMIHYRALFDDLVNEPASHEIGDYRTRSRQTSSR